MWNSLGDRPQASLATLLSRGRIIGNGIARRSSDWISVEVEKVFLVGQPREPADLTDGTHTLSCGNVFLLN